MEDKILYILNSLELLTIMFILLAIISVIFGYIISYQYIIKNIEIDGVNEVGENIITIKIDNNYYDYEYIGGEN